jgi:hypothetical protein
VDVWVLERRVVGVVRGYEEKEEEERDSVRKEGWVGG